MARRSYAEMAAEAGCTVEEYKARLAAKKEQAASAPVAVLDKPPVVQPPVVGDPSKIFPTHAALNAQVVHDGEDDAEEDKGEDKEDLSKIKLIDAHGRFGIIYHPKARYVTLLNRNYYVVETTGTRGRGKGKVYPAGTYGSWKVGEATFPASDADAIEKVAKIIYHESQAEAESLLDAAKNMRKVWQELKASFHAK